MGKPFRPFPDWGHTAVRRSGIYAKRLFSIVSADGMIGEDFIHSRDVPSLGENGHLAVSAK
jgi:hypothetical protein